jgi:prophage antirepressor-like protein
MSNIIPFNFHNNSVRVIEKDGDPWFIAKDVADLLGYANPLKAIRTHCKGVTETFTPTAGGQQEVKIIPERDVYRLIMRSKLPEAEAFEEWVVGEVLPAIRKNGEYKAPQLPDFNDPAAAARAWADQFEQAKLANEKLEVADQEIQRLQGVCHTIAAQFTPGMTPAQFCRQLNGVNVQQVQNYLAQRGLLIKERHGFKAASYYRDNWFAEKVSEPQEGIVATKVVLTKKGAVNLYKFYLKGDLPMKANWDGSHTHCLFDDKPQ